MLYFACKEFFGMTKHEFMYDHDIESIVDLIERHQEYHGMQQVDEASTNQTGGVEKIEFNQVKGFFN